MDPGDFLHIVGFFFLGLIVCALADRSVVSTYIAPIAVVIDGNINGYRDILLPLAYENSLVRKAIEVTSEYHQSEQNPDLRRQADFRYIEVVQCLRRRAEANNSSCDLASMSVWATVVILLLVETLSGETNLPYLLKMLRYVAKANDSASQVSPLGSFLSEQTRM